LGTVIDCVKNPGEESEEKDRWWELIGVTFQPGQIKTSISQRTEITFWKGGGGADERGLVAPHFRGTVFACPTEKVCWGRDQSKKNQKDPKKKGWLVPCTGTKKVHLQSHHVPPMKARGPRGRLWCTGLIHVKFSLTQRITQTKGRKAAPGNDSQNGTALTDVRIAVAPAKERKQSM